METRLKTAFRVQALLRRGMAECRPGAVVRKGDPDAGDLLLVLRGAGGSLAMRQARDANGTLDWVGIGPRAPATDAEIDAFLARQVAVDPDSWVVEIESPDLRPPCGTGWA